MPVFTSKRYVCEGWTFVLATRGPSLRAIVPFARRSRDCLSIVVSKRILDLKATPQASCPMISSTRLTD
jgi:hypothetical protein